MGGVFSDGILQQNSHPGYVSQSGPSPSLASGHSWKASSRGWWVVVWSNMNESDSVAETRPLPRVQMRLEQQSRAGVS